MKKVFILFLLFTAFAYSQVTTKKIYHPFTGTLAFSVEGGATYELTDYTEFANDYMGRVLIEYYLPTYSKSTFGLRLMGGAGFLRSRDKSIYPSEVRTNLIMAGGGFIYNLSLGEVVFPYFFGGASYLMFQPKDIQGKNIDYNNDTIAFKKNEINYNAELGIRILLADYLTLNFSGGVQISPNDNLDSYVFGNNDLFAYGLAGFTFSFFGENDSDGDGVVDSKDACPETPLGIKVDLLGCPFDIDKDGVPDYLDECPNTPQDVKVDLAGCPIDTDKDGIPDYLDICLNTPRDVKVDDFGCPIDSDNDGIPDYLDSCPGTPDGVKIDKFGCPADSDRDGIPDYLDNCPGTPIGEEVDQFGCPLKKEVPKPVIKEVVLSAGTTFAIGKANLLPGAYAELNNLLAAMLADPDSKWLIEGHTDNTGSLQINKKLSLQRAESVVNYLVANGIERNRFTVRGLGPDFPVADNSTEDGRAKNRRVKIIRTN
ncbi:MAG: OmpA family protein [Ignavibacteriaceae bacterium]